MPDPFDTKRAATCPSCGREKESPTIQIASDDFDECFDPFHSAHPVSAEGKRFDIVVAEANEALRMADLRIASLEAELEETRRSLTSVDQSLGGCGRQLAAAEARAAELERELRYVLDVIEHQGVLDVDRLEAVLGDV